MFGYNTFLLSFTLLALRWIAPAGARLVRLHLSISPFHLWRRDSDYEIYMLITCFILAKYFNLFVGTYHKVQDLHLICHGNPAGYCTRNVNLCSSHHYTGTAPQDSTGADRLGAHRSHLDSLSVRHISTRWEYTYKEKTGCSVLRIWLYRCTTILLQHKRQSCLNVISWNIQNILNFMSFISYFKC